jgi:methyl-accepting chemotaxis protein
LEVDFFMALAIAPGRTVTLEGMRKRATRLYTIIAWAHVPAVALIAISARNAWLAPTIALFVAAIVASIATRTMHEGLSLRLLMATVLTAAPIAFVYAGRGHTSGISGLGDWQIDYHMYFFAIFAILVGYVDWRPIALSAALTAVHHLLLDFIAPAAVFPEEGIDRVVLHALCVVAECGVLFWITNTVAQLFQRIDDLMDYTTQATAEALAGEIAEKAALQSEVDTMRALLAQRV